MTDERFATAELRDDNKDERINLTQEALLSFTTAELIERLEAEDVPCAPVLTRTEMRTHPQIVSNGIVVELEHEQAGKLRQARPPAVFSETKLEMRRGGPVYGAHTREVLGENGFSADEIAGLESTGAVTQADHQELTIRS